MFQDRAAKQVGSDPGLAVNPAGRDEESLFLAQPTQRCYRLRNRTVHPQAETDHMQRPSTTSYSLFLTGFFAVFRFFCLFFCLVGVFFCETVEYLHFLFPLIYLVMRHPKRKGSISWCSLAQTIYCL